MEIHEVLTVLKHKSGMTYQEIVDKSGYSMNGVTRACHGESNPSFDIVNCIVSSMGYKITFVSKNQPDNPNDKDYVEAILSQLKVFIDQKWLEDKQK